MNEFTKDELQYLDFALTRLAMLTNTMSEIHSTHNKIQSLIDNYCDHGSDCFIYTNSALSSSKDYIRNGYNIREVVKLRMKDGEL